MKSEIKRTRILFLGGAYSQVPIIEEAKGRDYYIITCDYLPGNPGHKLADEYHNISTTDFNGVLNIAKKVMPDLVIAYASDPAAPTAAYVSEKLGLVGNTFNSIRILTEKDLFRDFLSRNGFNSPKSNSFGKESFSSNKLNNLRFPVIVKPTDSSGSRGIRLVEDLSKIKGAVDYAFSFSRNKRIIVEELILGIGTQLHGDGFVENGKLIFSFLGDHHYNEKINPFVPFSTTWPSRMSPEIIKNVDQVVGKIIEKSGFRNGPINIEARVSPNGEVFIVEIGPRSGGNFVPQAIYYATGFNMVKASLDVLLGVTVIIPERSKNYSAYYVLHSEWDGKLKNLTLNENLAPFVREFHQYIKVGESVKSFQTAGAAIGILLLTFTSNVDMEYTIGHMDEFIHLEIERI